MIKVYTVCLSTKYFKQLVYKKVILAKIVWNKVFEILGQLLYWNFVLLFQENFFVGIYQKRLGEALLMSTDSICFHGEIRKTSPRYPFLPEAMIPN